MTIFERLAYSQPSVLLDLYYADLIDVYALAAEYGAPFPRPRARRYRRVKRRLRQVGGWVT